MTSDDAKFLADYFRGIAASTRKNAERCSDRCKIIKAAELYEQFAADISAPDVTDRQIVESMVRISREAKRTGAMGVA